MATAGADQHVGIRLHGGHALGDHQPPARHRGIDAETEEGERGLEENRVGHPEGGGDQDRPHGIGEKVHGDDARRARPQGPGRAHELPRLEAQDLAAHEATGGEPAGEPERDEHPEQPAHGSIGGGHRRQPARRPARRAAP